MKHVDFLQIGACSSAIHIFNKNLEEKNIILIEPNPYAFSDLVKNYTSRHKKTNYIFGNYAVSDKNGSVTFYIPSTNNDYTKLPSWVIGLGSINKDHIHKHIPSLIIDRITVPCFTLNTIIEQTGIESIDYLVIDTEGYDYNILMNIDFSIIKPHTIKFENKHMSAVFTRGQKYLDVLDKLYKYGYKLIDEDDEDTVVSL